MSKCVQWCADLHPWGILSQWYGDNMNCNREPRVALLMTLPSRVPEAEPDLAWFFLHSVLAVEVQFLTIASSFSHLVWRQTNMDLKHEGLELECLRSLLRQRGECVVSLWFAWTHLEHFLHTSHAWSGAQNLPDLHRHSASRVWVHALTISWSGNAAWKRPC